jgi:Sulfotransferase family
VLGCPRSGTTLLQVMLHSHPRLAIAPETRFILPAYRQRLRFGDLEQAGNRRALAEYLVAGRYFGNLGLDPDATIERIVDGPPTFGSAIGIVLQSYAERFGRPRWGEKRPGYYRHIDVVMRLFPDAQIVHLVRDPRDCVASLKRMPWWKRESHHSVLAWARAIDLTADAARRWPVTQVQYEQLVADPESELRRLCVALGEEYEPAMAEPERFVTEVVPDKGWHRSTRAGPATTARIGRWRGRLEPWELQLCEAVLAGRMERFGYELTGAGRPPVEHLVRYAYVRTTREQYRRLEQLRDRWRRRSEPNPVAARLTSGQLAAARG